MGFWWRFGKFVEKKCVCSGISSVAILVDMLSVGHYFAAVLLGIGLAP